MFIALFLLTRNRDVGLYLKLVFYSNSIESEQKQGTYIKKKKKNRNKIKLIQINYSFRYLCPGDVWVEH